MAAFHTLPHEPAIPQISKSGVLTLYGYGIRVTMQAGHLQLHCALRLEMAQRCWRVVRDA
ncbi:MAG: hypothetical protein DMG96_02225 [Acidobacteria bacterium]|nr:MAG: hypothetical protein DMG96_02225 [Acidobacteriota bacterium]